MSMNSVNDVMDNVEDYKGKLFEATVVSIDDPLHLERVKATILGLYEGDVANLPWIGPLKRSPFGQSETYGSYGVPQVGSTVIVELQNGDSNYPVYTGVLYKKVNNDFTDPKAWGFNDSVGNRLFVLGDKFEFKSAKNVVITIQADKLTVTAPSTITINTSADCNVNASGPVHVHGSTIDLN